MQPLHISRTRDPHAMDYARLPLTEVRTQLEALAREAQDTFGLLDDRQLNWRPNETRWSVGQCFEHLLRANQLVLRALDEALSEESPRTLWQRLPVWPRMCGQLLIRSQAPTASRKYSAPAAARPATSAIGIDVIARFVEQHRAAAASAQLLDERRAARTIMTSPFIGVVTYSVADGLRLVIAHDWRHVEQARRVTHRAGFPQLA
jgi:uncharacterized damage-inducible protein DinB